MYTPRTIPDLSAYLAVFTSQAWYQVCTGMQGVLRVLGPQRTPVKVCALMKCMMNSLCSIVWR